MSIRCSAKALILDEGRLLLNKCVSHAGVYYTLPGGGMHDGEILTEAVKREVMEDLAAAVEKKTGKTAMLKEKVDPSVIGGLKLQVAGMQYDNTIAYHLGNIAQLLSN